MSNMSLSANQICSQIIESLELSIYLPNIATGLATFQRLMHAECSLSVDASDFFSVT